MRTVLLVAATAGVLAAFWAIGETFLFVFVGIFLALVFEYPVRFVMAKTGWSRGLAATITVLGTAVGVLVIALLFLVPLVGSVRDFLQELPAIVEQLRQSDELSWLGDSGAAGERASGIREDLGIGAGRDLGRARDRRASFFSGLPHLLHGHLHLHLPAQRHREPEAGAGERADAGRGRALARRLGEGDDLDLTLGDRRRRDRTIAGTTQGVTAWLLGSSYAVALGVIAGLLDMIPNIGATIAGVILVPALWAEEGLTAAIIMLVVLLVYQQVENNILTPKIQGVAVNLSGFFIIVAVTLFGALLGVLGALTAVPLAATIQIFIQELTAARRAKVAAAKAALDAPIPEAPLKSTTIPSEEESWHQEVHGLAGSSSPAS